MKDGIRHEFADERRELRDIVSDLRYRVQNMINGQWWLAIPKWVYILFCVLFLAAGGFGYGFFYLLDQNGRLREIEWLYRRERTLYRTEKDRQLLINHEKDFFTGTPQEQDSIKDLIRYWEHEGGYDKPASTSPPPKTKLQATESCHTLGGFLRLTASYF